VRGESREERERENKGNCSPLKSSHLRNKGSFCSALFKSSEDVRSTKQRSHLDKGKRQTVNGEIRRSLEGKILIHVSLPRVLSLKPFVLLRRDAATYRDGVE